MNVNDSERNGRCSSLTYIESRVSIGCVFCFGLEFCIGKFVVFHSESKAEGTKSTTIIFVFCWIFIFFCCSDDYITKLVGLISQNSGVLFFICLKSSAVTSACSFFCFLGRIKTFSYTKLSLPILVVVRCSSWIESSVLCYRCLHWPKAHSKTAKPNAVPYLVLLYIFFSLFYHFSNFNISIFEGWVYTQQQQQQQQHQQLSSSAVRHNVPVDTSIHVFGRPCVCSLLTKIVWI